MLCLIGYLVLFSLFVLTLLFAIAGLLLLIHAYDDVSKTPTQDKYAVLFLITMQMVFLIPCIQFLSTVSIGCPIVL
jgi:hypothetical protein